jgi:hypothetical protein
MHVFPGGAALASLQLNGVHGSDRLAQMVQPWAVSYSDARL